MPGEPLQEFSSIRTGGVRNERGHVRERKMLRVGAGADGMGAVTAWGVVARMRGGRFLIFADDAMVLAGSDHDRAEGIGRLMFFGRAKMALSLW